MSIVPIIAMHRCTWFSAVAIYIINTREGFHPTVYMSSPNSPFLTHSEHYDEIEKDDELWTEYVSSAADADKQMIDESMKLVDTILVFVGFPM